MGMTGATRTYYTEHCRRVANGFSASRGHVESEETKTRVSGDVGDTRVDTETSTTQALMGNIDACTYGGAPMLAATVSSLARHSGPRSMELQPTTPESRQASRAREVLGTLSAPIGATLNDGSILSVHSATTSHGRAPIQNGGGTMCMDILRVVREASHIRRPLYLAADMASHSTASPRDTRAAGEFVGVVFCVNLNMHTLAGDSFQLH